MSESLIRLSGMRVIILPNSQKFINQLSKKLRVKVYHHLKLLEAYGYQLPKPYSKRVGSDLYELRVKSRLQLRFFYCFKKSQAIIFHQFIKKTSKIPRREIKLAIKKRRSL